MISVKSVIPKAADDDFAGRFREIISDPTNLLIKRDPLAGHVSNGLVTLHNGLKAPISGPGAYYGDFSMILVYNRGVHEPLEEFLFQEVLKTLPNKAVMLELGAYWAHYSMWLKAARPTATVYLVEPESENLAAGKANLQRNNLEGEFIQDFVGDGHFAVDTFLKSRGISHLDILHADIQGFELQMLHGASEALSTQAVDYVFVSTHSDDLHDAVMSCLISHGYRIEASSDFTHATTSFDGLVVASSPKMRELLPNFHPFSRSELGHLPPVSIVERLKRVVGDPAAHSFGESTP